MTIINKTFAIGDTYRGTRGELYTVTAIGTRKITGTFVYRLKDGVYDLVNQYEHPCTAPGRPVSQLAVRMLDKERHVPLISRAFDRALYEVPADAEIYTAEEVDRIDHPNRRGG